MSDRSVGDVKSVGVGDVKGAALGVWGKWWCSGMMVTSERRWNEHPGLDDEVVSPVTEQCVSRTACVLNSDSVSCLWFASFYLALLSVNKVRMVLYF